MNADEFVAAINRQAPPHLRHADRELLKRSQNILGSGPYYHEHITKAISLLGMLYEFLGKMKQQPKKRSSVSEKRSPIAISQIIVIHNFDAEQCYKIRSGLIKTGLINYEGLITVNFSRYTQRTIQSLPRDAFKDTDYHMEYSVFEQADSKGKTKPLGAPLNPVFFMKDVELTPVQLTLVLSGRRPPAIGRDAPLPIPLYQAFLNVRTDSVEAITDFMNTYKVYLFTMHYDSRQLSNYIAGIDDRLQLGIVTAHNQIKQFWIREQQKMRDVLDLATQGKLGQVEFAPIFPVCEEAIVEWRLISGYFDPGFLEAQDPKHTTLALFEFKGDKTSEAVVKVRRYYGWLDYMWAELADDIYRGKAALVCQRCGRIISRGSHGRPKRFCAPQDNHECYKARKAQYVAISQKK